MGKQSHHAMLARATALVASRGGSRWSVAKADAGLSHRERGRARKRLARMLDKLGNPSPAEIEKALR